MAAEKNGGKTLEERVRLIEDRLDIYTLRPLDGTPPARDILRGALEV